MLVSSYVSWLILADSSIPIMSSKRSSLKSSWIRASLCSPCALFYFATSITLLLPQYILMTHLCVSLPCYRLWVFGESNGNLFTLNSPYLELVTRVKCTKISVLWWKLCVLGKQQGVAEGTLDGTGNRWWVGYQNQRVSTASRSRTWGYI